MTQQTQSALHFLLQCHGSIFLDLLELGNAQRKLVSLLDFSVLLLLLLFFFRLGRRLFHPNAGCFIDSRENVGMEVQEPMQVCIHRVKTFAGLARLYEPSGSKNQEWEPVFQIVHPIAERRQRNVNGRRPECSNVFCHRCKRIFVVVTVTISFAFLGTLFQQ